MQRTLCRLCQAMLLAVTMSSFASECRAATTRVLFDFRDAEQRGSWVNVNDSVMGGVSEGRDRFTERGELEFSGRLSLANNGGFASVRSRPRPLGLQPQQELRLRVRGDGRKYYLDLRVPTSRTAFSYRVAMQTERGRWQEFRVPLSMFRASSFGRISSNAAPPVAGEVNSIGFTISDKKAGPFQLQVAWIKVADPEVTTLP